MNYTREQDSFNKSEFVGGKGMPGVADEGAVEWLFEFVGRYSGSVGN